MSFCLHCLTTSSGWVLSHLPLPASSDHCHTHPGAGLGVDTRRVATAAEGVERYADLASLCPRKRDIK